MSCKIDLNDVDFLVADCETNPFDGESKITPFVWGLSDGTNTEVFYDTVEFVERIKSLETVCYAHNGGRFDWLLIVDELNKYEPVTVISSRLAKARIGECEIRDSINILPVPLSAFKKDEIDYNIFTEQERDKKENKKAIRDYLVSDCIYLHELISRFRDEYGAKLTIAGTAMGVWEGINGKEDRSGSEFYDEVSKYYIGGRVQCFRKGMINSEFKVIDINSAYPFAMSHELPHGTVFSRITSIDGLSSSEVERSFITLECVAGGSLPHRDEKGNVAYPVDERKRFHVSGWEFLAGVETGAITDYDIEEVLIFEKTINFNGYLNRFFKQKVESKERGDKAGEIIAKLFLNSLYGKFGSCPDNYRENMLVDLEDVQLYAEDGYVVSGQATDDVYIISKRLEDEDEEAGYYNVAVAASITGFVRAYLWRAINKCEGVIYCDTDSIVCESSGDLELHPTDLGAWDLEAECVSGGVAGKKLYAFKTKEGNYKTACKGVRLEPRDILRVCAGEEVVYNAFTPTFSIKKCEQKYLSRRVNMT